MGPKYELNFFYDDPNKHPLINKILTNEKKHKITIYSYIAMQISIKIMFNILINLGDHK